MKFRALAAIAAGLLATAASAWLQAQAGQGQLPELPIVRPAATAPAAARVPVLIEL